MATQPVYTPPTARAQTPTSPTRSGGVVAQQTKGGGGVAQANPPQPPRSGGETAQPIRGGAGPATPTRSGGESSAPASGHAQTRAELDKLAEQKFDGLASKWLKASEHYPPLCTDADVALVRSERLTWESRVAGLTELVSTRIAYYDQVCRNIPPSEPLNPLALAEAQAYFEAVLSAPGPAPVEPPPARPATPNGKPVNRLQQLAADFATKYPKYANGDGSPNMYHISNAARAEGFPALAEKNLEQIFEALTKRAERGAGPPEPSAEVEKAGGATVANGSSQPTPAVTKFDAFKAVAPVAMDAPTTLATKIAHASTLVGGALSPDKRNKEQNYEYVSADKIVAEGGRALAQAGLSVCPSIGEVSIAVVERPGKSPRLDACVRIIFVVSDGVSEMSLPWFAIGCDFMTPDKALSKAITSGHRYFLANLLNIGAGYEE